MSCRRVNGEDNVRITEGEKASIEPISRATVEFQSKGYVKLFAIYDITLADGY